MLLKLGATELYMSYWWRIKSYLAKVSQGDGGWDFFLELEVKTKSDLWEKKSNIHAATLIADHWSPVWSYICNSIILCPVLHARTYFTWYRSVSNYRTSSVICRPVMQDMRVKQSHPQVHYSSLPVIFQYVVCSSEYSTTCKMSERYNMTL